MGFYVRKSFRAGPVRLNLSKRGLGVSAGVTGARLGIRSDGRAYSHMGRKGLYRRQALSGGQPTRARSSPSTVREIAVETDATYASPEQLPTISLRDKLVEPSRANTLWFLLAAILAVVSIVAAISDSPTLQVLTPGALAIVLLPIAVFGVRANHRARRYGHQLQELFAQPARLDNLATEREVESLHATAGVSKEVRTYHARSTYLEMLRTIVEDGAVDAHERGAVELFERLFELDAEFIKSARLETYREVFLEVVSDRILDEEEEAALSEIRDRLEISPGSISEELRLLEQLRELREIREGSLPVIEVSVKLQKGEVCHFMCPARMLKSKILETMRREGVQYKMRGLEIAKEGELFITSKRILLLHEGTSNIPHEKILDLEVDSDRNLLTITKDEVATPVYLTTPESLKAGAIIAALAKL